MTIQSASRTPDPASQVGPARHLRLFTAALRACLPAPASLETCSARLPALTAQLAEAHEVPTRCWLCTPGEVDHTLYTSYHDILGTALAARAGQRGRHPSPRDD